MWITSFVENIFLSFIESIEEFYKNYINLKNVAHDNKILREENKILLNKILEVKKLKLENEKIRSLCEFKLKNQSFDLTSAKIIGKDLTPFFKVIKIYIKTEEKDELKPDLPVITNEGVVGKITKVSGRFAEVMLTVDPRSQINVEVMGKGIKGTLYGKGGLDSYLSKFIFLDKNNTVNKGDIVITSGHDRVFPRGLEVGYISNPEAVQEEGIYYEYKVMPSVDFSDLEDVLIIKGFID